MNKIIFLIFIFYSENNFCIAQPGQWTWLKGSNTGNNAGVYGTQGIPAATNEPPAVYEACEWTDLNGNFWLYGGVDFASGSLSYNDLWKYDPVSNEWTWMKGTHTLNDPGTYGSKGVPSPSNLPPGLGWGCATWTDHNGDLWLFGGAGFNGDYADLWRYNIASNQWTCFWSWSAFGQIENYGTMTVPDTSNFPGRRHEIVTAWVDNNGDLCFFGGYIGNWYNDLWRYNISTNTFTWMKGSNTTNQSGSWGVKGVEDPANIPSARSAYTHWKDNQGNLWMMGGWAGDTIPPANCPMGDMWRYNPVTNNWTWMNGLNYGSPSQFYGHYGTKCLADSLNYPPHRFETRSVWTDSQGNFWLFGGATSTVFSSDTYNDLWKYCVSTNRWIWISGDTIMNSAGSYGTQGTSSPTIRPPSRSGSLSWRDNNNLYLFGGLDAVGNVRCLGDLWKFEIDTTCGFCPASIQLPLTSFTSSDSNVCEGVCVNFINHSQFGSSYQWNFPGGMPSADTTANPPAVCYPNSGSYDVTLTVTNGNGSATAVITNLITVFPPVQFSPISQTGDTLFSVAGYSSYQWFYNNNPITGAVNYFYVANQNGNYSVNVIDSNGCEASATIIDVITGINDLKENLLKYFVQYNNGIISIQIISDISTRVKIELYNSVAEEIYSGQIKLLQGKNNFELTQSDLSKGIYLLKMTDSKHTIVNKILVE
jgi:PKD repeat protein